MSKPIRRTQYVTRSINFGGTKKFGGKGRFFVRKKSYLKYGQTSQNTVHRFKRTMDGNNMTYINAGVETAFGQRYFSQVANSINTIGFEFRLGDLPNYTEFTALFDQYRIDKIVFKIIPMCNVNQLTINSTGALSNNPGIIGTVIDYDDAGSPTSLGYMEQYQNFRYQPVVSSRTMMRAFKPRIAVAAYGQGLFTSYMNKKATWIDCNSPAVPHYGLKIYLDGANGTAPTCLQTYQLFADVYLSFRNVR